MRCLRLSLVAFAVMFYVAACAPTAYILDADFKIPAKNFVPYWEKDCAFYIATKSFDRYLPLKDSFAKGFTSAIERSLRLEQNTMPVYTHNLDLVETYMPDFAYSYPQSLASDTAFRGLMFMLDELTLGRLYSLPLDEYNTVLAMNLYGKINVFDVDKNKVISTLHVCDTLCWDWDENELSPKSIGLHVKLSKEAMEGVSTLVVRIGEKSAKTMKPYWERQERIFFCADSRLWDKAFEYAIGGKWDKAEELWMQLYNNSKSAQNRCAAAYNLALASEMMGNPELALEWLEHCKSFVREQWPEIKQYDRILKQRIEEKKQLEESDK